MSGGQARQERSRGRLMVVGTGIRPQDHLTPESRQVIADADLLLYLVHGESAERYVCSLRQGPSQSLLPHYRAGQPLGESYEGMIRAVLQPVREGRQVCFALYGHPGVFVYPSHRAVELARAEGLSATMLPGISAADCLYADLGIDPARTGCLSLWANDLLFQHRQLDGTCMLIVWSIGVVGELSFVQSERIPQALSLLLQKLGRHYPPTHPAIIYEAPIEVGHEPVIKQLTLGQLRADDLSSLSTLVLPPLHVPLPDYTAQGLLGGQRHFGR